MDHNILTFPVIVANVAQMQIINPRYWSFSIADIFIIGMIDATHVPNTDNSSAVLFIYRHQPRSIVTIIVNVQDIRVALAIYHARYFIAICSVDTPHFYSPIVGYCFRAVSIFRIEILDPNFCCMFLNVLWISTVLPILCRRPVASWNDASAVCVKANINSFTVNVVVARYQERIAEEE